jgi:molybdenum cofactor cytidylyltransferase
MPVKKTTQHRPALGVIILGAGDSVRMGRPKLMLPWGGTSIIGHLISQWQTLKADQIAVVLRPGDQVMEAELDRVEFPPGDRIENPLSGRGMFSSIQCAANWDGWKAGLNVWAIILGDQPHLRPETLRQLLQFSAQNKEAICQPAFGGSPRHPVLLPRPAFVQLRHSGAETLKDFLQQTSCQRRQHAMEDLGLMLDLDYPEDYDQAFKSYQ